MFVAANPSFGRQLTKLREEAGLTQYALAKQSGVTAQAISMLEKGSRDPSWSTVVKLARALNVTVAAFDVEGDERPKGKPKKGE